MSLFVIDTKGNTGENFEVSDVDEEVSENAENDNESSEEGSGASDDDSGESSDSEESESEEDSEPEELFPISKRLRIPPKPSRHKISVEEKTFIDQLSAAKAARQNEAPKSLVDTLATKLSLEDDDEDDDDFIVLPQDSDGDTEDGPVVIKEIPKLKKWTVSEENSKKKKKNKHEDYSFDDVYFDSEEGATKTLKEVRREAMHKLLQEKSIAMKPGLEKMECIPNPNLSDHKLRKLRKAERAKTKGGDWFNLPATEVTEEVKRDLEVLQMRSVLDPKTFYKKNDLKVLPKYFQIGHVEDNAADFYHSRIPKKDRKRTMVEELMADAEFQQRSKQKFKEIVQEKKRVSSKAHRAAQRLKKRK